MLPPSPTSTRPATPSCDRTRCDPFNRDPVVLQFGLALTWGFAERSTTHLMIVTNMSLGILLATVLVVRIVWRLMPGHGVASKTVHFLLYILLVAQATSGFVLRWSGNEAMSFFGVLIPPTVAPFSKPAHEIVYVR